MNRLVAPERDLRRLMQEAVLRPGGAVRFRVGRSRTAAGVEILALPMGRMASTRNPVEARGEVEEAELVVRRQNARFDEQTTPPTVARVWIDRDPADPHIAGVVWHDERCVSLDELAIVGAGWRRIPVGRPPHSAAQRPRATPELDGPWSRTAGGLGIETWLTMTTQRVGVVGLGRTGSAVALALSKAGVQRIALIDADALEASNVAETDGVTPGDVGKPKAQIIGDWLTHLASPPPEIDRSELRVGQWEPIRLLKQCDAIFSCVDNDAGRLATAYLAAAYHRPLFDVASGIHGHGDQRRMGFDVRFVLPGDCLLCLGGLNDEAAAREQLRTGAYLKRDARPWHATRTGSLRSLNHTALNLALRMFEDWVDARITASRRVRGDFLTDGRLELRYEDAQPRRPCDICQASGVGDAAWERRLNPFAG